MGCAGSAGLGGRPLRARPAEAAAVDRESTRTLELLCSQGTCGPADEEAPLRGESNGSVGEDPPPQPQEKQEATMEWPDLYSQALEYIDKHMDQEVTDESMLHSMDYTPIVITVVGNLTVGLIAVFVSSCICWIMVASGRAAWYMTLFNACFLAAVIIGLGYLHEGGQGGALSREVVVTSEHGAALYKLLAVCWSLRPAPSSGFAARRWVLGMVRVPSRSGGAAAGLKSSFHKRVVLNLKHVGSVLPWGFRVHSLRWQNEKSAAKEVDLLARLSEDAAVGDSWGPSEAVRRLVEGGAIRPGGRLVMALGEETRIMFLRRCFRHRAFQASLSILVGFLLTLPTTMYLERVQALQSEYCRARGYFAEVDPLRCHGKQEVPCPELCVGGIAYALFISAVNRSLRIASAELALPLALVFVCLTVLAIRREESVRHRRETFFIHRSVEDSATRADIHTTKQAMEDLINFRGACTKVAALARQLTQRGLWACSSAAMVEARVGQYRSNRTFAEVMAPVHHACDLGDEVINIELRPDAWGGYKDGELIPVTFQDMMEKVLKFWEKMGRLYELKRGMSAEDSFKVIVYLPLHTAQVFDIITNDFLLRQGEDGYREQLEWVCNASAESVQDEPEAQSRRDFRLGALVVPRGFAMSEVHVQPPENGPPRDILLGHSSRVKHATRTANFEAFCRLFDSTSVTKQADGSLDVAGFHVHDLPAIRVLADTPTPLTQGEESEDSDSQPGALPTLSFFSNPSKVFGDTERQCNDSNFEMGVLFQRSSIQKVGDKKERAAVGLWEEMDDFFRRLKDEQIQEVVSSAERKTPFDEFKRRPLELQESAVVVVQIQHSRRKLMRKIRSLCMTVLAPQVFIMLVCICFANLIPLWRAVFEGGSLFPGPLAIPLFLNTLATAISFIVFFSIFETEVMRFNLVWKALQHLQARTRSHPDGVPNEVFVNPFRLHDPCLAPWMTKSRNSMQQWRNRFTVLARNVRHWTTTEDLLRDSLSVNRVTSSVMLVVAAMILIFLLGFSLAETAAGQGMIRLNQDKLHDMARRDIIAGLEYARNRGHNLTGSARLHLQGAVAEAQSLLHEKVNGAAAEVNGALQKELDGSSDALSETTRNALATSDRRLSDSAAVAPGGVAKPAAAAAVRSLQAALEPFEVSLRQPLTQQLDALLQQAEDLLPPTQDGRRLSRSRFVWGKLRAYMSLVQGIDPSKVTKTQLLTLSMMLVVLIFSSRLILAISLVNAIFAGNPAILTHEKAQHVKNQQRREQAGVELGVLGSSLILEDIAEAAEAETLAEKAKSRYEQLLDSSIQASRSKANHWALRVFGFVITPAILIGNVAIVVVPFVSQAKAAAPALVVTACEFVEDSVVFSTMQYYIDTATTATNEALVKTNQAIENASDRVDDAIDAAVDDARKRVDAARRLAQNATTEVEYVPLLPEVNLKRSFHETICRPMLAGVLMQVQDLSEKVGDASRLRDDERNREVAALVRQRWHNVMDDGDEGDGDGDGDGGEEGRGGDGRGNGRKGRQPRRRLGAGALPEEVSDRVAAWWAQHPEVEPREKLAIVQTEVDALHRKVDDWLVASPSAVHAAYRHGGLTAGLGESLERLRPSS